MNNLFVVLENAHLTSRSFDLTMSFLVWVESRGLKSASAHEHRLSLCGMTWSQPPHTSESILLGCLEAPTNLQRQSLTGAQRSQSFQRELLHKEALHTKEVVISVSAGDSYNEHSPLHTKRESCLLILCFYLLL